ncbi:MAG: hypothetical protein CL917_02010 [Deltaproteobacteria bacterium]|nr:hypothetical protein [Deltaproteobacteria bacterium]
MGLVTRRGLFPAVRCVLQPSRFRFQKNQKEPPLMTRVLQSNTLWLSAGYLGALALIARGYL